MWAFATPWPAPRAILSIVKPVVHLREEVKGCRIADAESGSMSVLKMVNNPLPVAPIVGGNHHSLRLVSRRLRGSGRAVRSAPIRRDWERFLRPNSENSR